MPIKQLTIFLENQTGRLAEVTKILKKQDINLQGFSTTEARDYGILRLIVSDTERARQ
ncbi:MAG: amino acid-binding protein, partial [Actinobacteria bacterium]|nr:amino acid-binding protein [Actinomycetota bacterium]